VREDEDGEVWRVVRVLTYRWSRTKEGDGRIVSGIFACPMNQRAVMMGDLDWQVV
jgi:hypothetical protein